MKNDIKENIVLFILILIVFALGIGIGVTAASRVIRSDAVVNGHAEWISNEYGDTTFVWKK